VSVLFSEPITFGKKSEFHADVDSLNLVPPIRSKEEAILVFRLVQYTVIIIMVKRYCHLCVTDGLGRKKWLIKMNQSCCFVILIFFWVM